MAATVTPLLLWELQQAWAVAAVRELLTPTGTPVARAAAALVQARAAQVLQDKDLPVVMVHLTLLAVAVAQVLLAQTLRLTLVGRAVQVCRTPSPVLRSLMAAVVVDAATLSQVVRQVQAVAVQVAAQTIVLLALQGLPTQAAAQAVVTLRQRVAQALWRYVTLVLSVAQAARSRLRVGTPSTPSQRLALTAHRRRLWAVM